MRSRYRESVEKRQKKKWLLDKLRNKMKTMVVSKRKKKGLKETED